MSKELIKINDQSISEKDVYEGIGQIIVRLNETGDLQGATKVLNSLDALNNVTGKAKAYLLWGMEQWYSVNKPQDDFGDYIESTTTTKRITVTRYINVWKQIEDEQIPKRIQAKPMRELVKIASLIEQGFVPTKDEWDSIDVASNASELGEVILKIKGKKPRKSGMKITIERDGSLYVYHGDAREYVGYLALEETNDDVQKAIERILSGANIIRR